MTKFRRELGDELLDCFQKAPSWWRHVTEHKSLAIAVRYKYLNVYSNGQSIFKVTQKSGSLVAETHYKYLLNEATPEYRSFRNNEFATDGLTYIEKYEGKKTLDRLISNANVYAGEEKKLVHDIISQKNNSNVIDLEVTFTTSEKSQEGPNAEIETEKKIEKAGIDRIDMVALEERDQSIWIVFYEVKTINDSRLRARENAEVIGQLSDYKRAIEARHDEIVTAYRQVCSDLIRLNRQVGGPGQINALIERVAKDDKKALKIDRDPRLIIVGYKGGYWNSPEWQGHLKKLTDKLGTDRVIGWGRRTM
jgi:hypothetical protein